MRSLLAIATLAACTDPTGLGAATSSAHPTVRSATTTIRNVTFDGTATYRLWSVELGERAPDVDCHARGDALLAFDVFTIFDSAPRGVIPLTTAPPPPTIFPALYAQFVEGAPIEGAITIDAAASSGLFGSFTGAIAIEGTRVDLEVEFTAPTCGD